LSASRQGWKLWLAVVWMVAGVVVSDGSAQNPSAGLGLLGIFSGIGPRVLRRLVAGVFGQVSAVSCTVVFDRDQGRVGREDSGWRTHSASLPALQLFRGRESSVAAAS